MSGLGGRTRTAKDSPKLFEGPFLSSIVVPFAIVLVGSLIVFGVSRMISVDRTYKDLVRELESKTFGNRWVAAYELSKVIASSQIPIEEHAELIKTLTTIYKGSVDPRTRDFLVVATGALKNPASIPLLETALEDRDPKVKFHSLVAISNLPRPATFNWEKVIGFLESKDSGLKQAAIFTLATHKVDNAQVRLEQLLSAPNLNIRFSAATALVSFKNSKALPVLSQILTLKPEGAFGFNKVKVAALKLNVLEAIKRNKWMVLKKEISELSNVKGNPQLSLRAQEVLNLLKY